MITLKKILLTFVCLTSSMIHAQTMLPTGTSNYWKDSIPEVMRQSYIAYANEYLGRPWASIPDSVFGEFRHKGNRTHYEQLCFQKRTQLAAIAMGEIIEGKGRFIPDLIAGLNNLLGEPWWGIPAHYGPDHPKESDQTVDLFNAETAGLVAWIRYMLADRLGDEMQQRIDKEIDKRLLNPALNTNYWWKHSRMNWTPWICSNWLTAVLISEKDETKKREAIRQIRAALQTFIDGYPNDGGCDEGTFYWDRAAGSLFDCIELMESFGLTTKEFASNLKVKAMASYIYKMYIGNGFCVNFADAHDNHAVVQLNVLYPFALWTDDITMRRYAAWIAQQQGFFRQPAKLFAGSGNFPTLGRELFLLTKLRQLQSEKPCEPKLESVWLPDLQIMTARRKLKNHKTFYVAMKGGTNGESHNHNDIGSFIVYANARPLLIDPGVGEYTSATFSAKRYEIWTMQSAYHNLPQINGFDQHEGTNYHATKVQYEPFSLAMDIASAYPKEAKVKMWKRSLSLKRGDSIEINEHYQLEKWMQPQRIMLLTPVQPIMLRRGVLQLGDNQLLYPHQQVTVKIEDISSKMDILLHKVWGDNLYRIVMTIDSKQLTNNIKYTLK